MLVLTVTPSDLRLRPATFALRLTNGSAGAVCCADKKLDRLV
jgi:hypothetical protein